jgi:hypothetical protein
VILTGTADGYRFVEDRVHSNRVSIGAADQRRSCAVAGTSRRARLPGT